MKVARLIIRNYAGVEAADIKVPPGGILITGGNARGKTSIYRALRAALKAQGVDPEAIRQGAEKAEILVDLDKLHVRTVIRQKGEETDVMDQSGEVQRKPRTILNDIFGDELDPLAFYQAKDKERRRMIYEVIPMTVTVEDVKRWTNGLWNDPDDVRGPGLELIARYRLAFYNRRTQANADAEASHHRLKDLQAQVDQLVKGRPVNEDAPKLADADRHLQEARSAWSALKGKEQAYEAARQKAGPTRERVAQLRQLSASEPTGAGPQLDLRIPGERVRESAALVERLKKELAETELRHQQDVADLALMGLAAKNWKDAIERRAEAGRQADQLEASLAGVEAMNVPAAGEAAAADRIAICEEHVRQAQHAEEFHRLSAQVQAATAKAAADAEKAAGLDCVVRNLTTVAPRELAERSGGIPGLAVGEKITLDGVVLDDLAGLEQLQFAVDLAKRVRGSKGKLLLVDKLEAIDEDELGAFLKMAVKGGWQIIGTRVTKGELEIVAVAGDEEVDDG